MTEMIQSSHAAVSKVRDPKADIMDGRTRWNLSLRNQLRWLRVCQKPYMTQAQLAVLARTDGSTISEFERGKTFNIGVQTLRRWVRALGCELYIKIESKPSRAKGAFLLEGPALPPPPKLIRKATGVGRWQAEEYARLMGRKGRHKTVIGRRRAISGKDDSQTTPAIDPLNPFDFDATEHFPPENVLTSPPKRRGRPRSKA